MLDITAKSGEQQEAEAAVEAFRNRLGPFVVAAEKTRMPMIFTDAAHPDHPIIFANRAFLALTGYEREEVLAKSLKSLMAVGIDLEAMARVEAAFASDGASDSEIHYRRKDGSEFWASLLVSPVCDESGRVVQQFVSFVDLTRHRQEEARCKMLIDELKGFGSWVIERGLTHELGAKVALDYLPGGLACTMDIPAPAGTGE